MVEPAGGRNFVVIEAKATSTCDPAGWHRCTRWCGRYGRPPEQVEEGVCLACLGKDLIEGTLQSQDGDTYPVLRGIPRVLGDCYLSLVPGLHGDWLKRHRKNSAATGTDFDRLQIQTATAFGEEWQYFSQNLADYEGSARSYFDLLAPNDFSGMILDAGCGMGRWAYKAGQHARTLLAVDLSSSVDQAAMLLSGLPNTHVVQADLHQLPFRSSTFDLIYSLGVLHHLPDPLTGLDGVVRHLKPGGKFLAYFYYALDNRPWYFHVILWFVTGLRFVISRLPHRVARLICCAIALTVYWPLVQFGNCLCAIGLERAARQVPLYEFYAGKSFRSLFNDSVDRFATRLEFRFTRERIREMFAKVGLLNAQFSNTTPFWKVLGVKAMASGPPRSVEGNGP